MSTNTNANTNTNADLSTNSGKSFDIKTVCTPVKVYVVVALILLCCMSLMAFQQKNIAQGFADLMPNILGMICCTIILWLLCVYVSPTASWVLLVILLIFPICLFSSMVSTFAALFGYAVGRSKGLIVHDKKGYVVLENK